MSILNSTFQIHGVNLSNRLVMPPMASGKAGQDGSVLPELCAYYDQKSKNGYIGLIITEHAYVSSEGKAHEGQLSIAKDSDVSGLKKLVNVIHKNGTKVVAQISHAGGAAKREVTGCDIVSASAIKTPRAGSCCECPREMTIFEIEKTILDFTLAAERAKEAGFDGVEIHAAHGYLLNQFYSPLTNRRKDDYGGASIEGRLKLPIKIIHSIRKALGDDFLIAIRLGACDYMPGGTTLEDSIQAAHVLEKAGIDLLDISGGFCGPYRSQSTEQGYFKELSLPIKQQISIPVLLTGGITTSEGAEALLKDGAADLIGVGRTILRDSRWAQQTISSLQ